MEPEILRPTSEDNVLDIVETCLADTTPVEIRGAGTKRALGRPVTAETALTTQGLSGITLYEPAELVLRAHAGTPLSDVRNALDQHGQQLAFEPPDWGPLLGGPADAATIGGVVACNLSGPRRFRAGAARDHLLGARIVTGRAEVIKTGGRVVKNVTGYDLCKLISGSYGTLGVVTELTLKVLPASEKTRTMLVLGLDAPTAQAAMNSALNSPHDVSGAAYLPKVIANQSSVGYVADANNSVTALRIEGPEPSVLARSEAIRELMAAHGEVEELHYHNSKSFWCEVGNATVHADGTSSPVWRISVPPANMAQILATLAADDLEDSYADWGGGLLWVRVPEAVEDGGASVIRRAISPCGGHATLVRGSDDLRSRIPVFQPAPDAVAVLSARIKDGFDPQNILNPGRMTDRV